MVPPYAKMLGCCAAHARVASAAYLVRSEIRLALEARDEALRANDRLKRANQKLSEKLGLI